jgi:hypothetical protein
MSKICLEYNFFAAMNRGGRFVEEKMLLEESSSEEESLGFGFLIAKRFQQDVRKNVDSDLISQS